MQLCVFVVVVFIVRSKAANFESKDYTSYESCIEVTEVLQACGAQCRKICSEGKLQLVTHWEENQLSLIGLDRYQRYRYFGLHRYQVPIPYVM